MALAKLETKNNEKYFQTLYGHTLDALKISKYFIDNNYLTIENFCGKWNLKIEELLKSVFQSVYLHDVGKLTIEFQKNISEGKKSQKYPHPFFSVPILIELDSKFFCGLPLETCAVLGHHTQLYADMYSSVNTHPKYMHNEIKDFLNQSTDAYFQLGFNKLFEFDGFRTLSLDNHKPTRIRRCINNINRKTYNFKDKVRLKAVYSFIFSILQLGDDYSSSNFADFISIYNGDRRLFDSVIDSAESFVPLIDITSDFENQILEGNNPYSYQGELSDHMGSSLLFAPCGRGKTEAALLWGSQFLKNKRKNKIIFAMPTQVTSNAMYDRLCIKLGKGNKELGTKYVGLFHGKSMIKLGRDIKENDSDNEYWDEDDILEIKGENLKGSIFFKPITITTIDHLILCFVHGFPQSDFSLGNLQNSLIVFDEVHYYEKQTLEHLITLFQILNEMKIPHLLMSGTLPNFLLEKINKENEYGKPVTDKEGILFTPFKVVKHNENMIEIHEDELIPNPKVLQKVISEYKNNKRIFIICNTVRRAQAMWSSLYEYCNVTLYHSQYTFNDRIRKEEQIFNNKDLRPYILVATQTIEISLNISCDTMFSEIAPPDAIGQRAGRLHRGGKNYIENGHEFILNLYRTPDMENMRKSPYDPALLKLSFDSFQDKTYNYKEIKEVCDSVYEKYGYNLRIPTELRNFFEKNVLFGNNWKSTSYGIDEARNLDLRSNEYQKISVIPMSIYNNIEANLRVENEVQVPLWMYLKDERENIGDTKFFYTINSPKKEYIICRIPYSFEKGIDYEEFFKGNPHISN
mgnify:FL=1